MDDFPVNQAKDGFIWDDGLEDAFIDELESNIQEYIEIADLSIKERDAESQYSDEKSEELHKEVENAIQKAFNKDFDNIDDNEESSFHEENDNLESEEDNSDIQQYVDGFIEVETEEKILGTERNYPISLSLVEQVDFTVKWATGNNDYWIDYNEYEQDKYDVTINIEHPFFMPFSKDPTFKIVLEKFALAFILSEREAKYASDREGYVLANVIRHFMNGYLQKLAGD